jgi:hypothetical protein
MIDQTGYSLETNGKKDLAVRFPAFSMGKDACPIATGRDACPTDLRRLRRREGSGNAEGAN